MAPALLLLEAPITTDLPPPESTMPRSETKTNPIPNKTFDFLNLLPSIRYYIYLHVLTQPSHQINLFRNKDSPPALAHLLHVCEQIHGESRMVL
jgi:hypothetical protein